MRFKDKSVIITGGGGKIAKAYAMAFAKEGAKLSLPDLASADHMIKAIKDMGGTAVSMACDVSNEHSVKAMVEETVKQFGTVDVLINNAAYFMTVWKGPFWEMTVEEFDKAMAVNVRGSWLCAKAVVPHMQKQKKGKIINISSNVALTGNPNYIHYVTSKGALIAMTRAMARELGEWNICVNTVSPGFVVTEGRQVDAQYEKLRAPTAQHQAFPSRKRFSWNSAFPVVVGKRLHDRPTAQRRRWVSFRRMRILFWLISPQQSICVAIIRTIPSPSTGED
ncbi:MAG: SDR family oxidoreductase [Deltaproteobacteria bacterium]|nr:MAG: SDR family oxidoreductase [Deltaproteobacteria bacterium]